MKIGICGDLHFKDKLGYSAHIEDARAAEEKEVLDFIVESFADTSSVIFVGDQLNAKNNSSFVVNKLVNFLERFNGKELYILAGNHEKSADGKTAIDFLREIKGKKWHIITNEVLKTPSGLVFCPYMYKSELGERDNVKASKKLLRSLPEGEILFVHHAISDTPNTEFFDEIVLDRKELEKKYSQIIAGHVHKPCRLSGNTLIAGSVFNDEAGETGKLIYKIVPGDSLNICPIELPGRPIYKVTDENATVEHLQSLKKSAIVKMVLTKKLSAKKVEELKAELRNFDAHVILENYPTERRKAAMDRDVLSVNTEELLGIYAKQNKIDVNALLKGWQLVKTI
jgi:DNA repair exonuclease SbcCD nuclease subunit